MANDTVCHTENRECTASAVQVAATTNAIPIDCLLARSDGWSRCDARTVLAIRGEEVAQAHGNSLARHRDAAEVAVPRRRTGIAARAIRHGRHRRSPASTSQLHRGRARERLRALDADPRGTTNVLQPPPHSQQAWAQSRAAKKGVRVRRAPCETLTAT